MIVTNPLGQSIMVNKVVKECSLSFARHVFLVDLMLLNFREFDSILGLDWLMRHDAVVECKSRGVSIVNEFPDIFPEELSGILPNRDVEFFTIVTSRIAPISSAPYRVAQVELK
ncbi:DNA/RNA polymerases superfamily protein [Gossypium australe]|uniref:DNA/RNA polymerases superfamily protein n=1 Tax=Gossypium australe TaxID=47621 RepID=A0A5B6X3E0_9ROSI|nr:DNA/RNA polymerases superfamily protein [Gossypium australe]